MVIAAVELVDSHSPASLYRVFTHRLGQAYGVAARPDFMSAVAAMLGVMVFDTLPGLFIGIGVSLLLLLYRSSRRSWRTGATARERTFAALDRHSESRRIPGVIVLRVQAGRSPRCVRRPRWSSPPPAACTT